MAASNTHLSETDRRLLVSYYAFYRSLETGMRVPNTKAQHHFIAVCRGETAAQTDHERAFQTFRRIIAERNLDEDQVLFSAPLSRVKTTRVLRFW